MIKLILVLQWQIQIMIKAFKVCFIHLFNNAYAISTALLPRVGEGPKLVHKELSFSDITFIFICIGYILYVIKKYYPKKK